MTAKTIKTPRTLPPKPDETANGNGQGTRKRRELTLDEMSLRAYKMTYEQLHGKGKKKTVKKQESARDVAKLPKAA
jgi:hypothetical protein